MGDDTTTKLAMFLIMFWAIMIIGSYFLSPVLANPTNADLDSLNNNGSITAFTSLWNLMSFRISGSNYFFVGIILDVIAILTILTAYKLIIGR